MRREGCSPWWSTPARLGGSGFDDGGNAGALGGDGVHNEMRSVEASSRVETIQISSSYNGSCIRPERCDLGGAPAKTPGCSGALQIRKVVRGLQLDKTRRTGGVRGSGVYGNTRVDGVPKLFSGEISSSFDLAAWRRFGEIR
jgi:hypothetical protein